MDLTKRNIVGWLVLIFLALDLLSISAFFYPWWQSLICICILASFLYITISKPGMALLIITAELILGSTGYWFAITLNEQAISLRIALFLILMTRLVVSLKIQDLKQLVKVNIIKWWLGAMIVIVLAGLHGLKNGFGVWFLDINAYLFLLYFIPLYWWRQEWFKYIRPVVIASLIYLIIKSLGLFYLYTHIDAFDLLPIYDWVRNTGFGEITYAGGGWFRIFSQSHVFILLASTLALGKILIDSSKRLLDNVFGLTIGVLSVAVLLASMSRSFWLGILGAILVAVVYLWFKRIINFSSWSRFVIKSIIITALSVGVLIIVLMFPIPKPLAGDVSALINRSTQGVGEAAGQSRLRLLPPLYQKISDNFIMGDGFGSTVTYFSTDPRIVRSTAGGSGEVTTHAFEWGYLDMWLKMGLIGMLVYLIFFFNLFKQAIAKINDLWHNNEALPILIAILALLIANITTPYLNHPLGIGSLMIAGLYLLTYADNQKKTDPPINY